MNDSDTFLQNKGKMILNTKEYALEKDDALDYLGLLHQEKKIILGGDVYMYDESKEELKPIYDNWYLDQDGQTIDDSYIYTKNYIENYKNYKNTYFIIVT